MFQVEYVDMLEEQSVAYKKAVDEYRALAEAARAAKALKKASINLVDALPRRQVTNIFTQLRKVRKFSLKRSGIFSALWISHEQCPV